jgi:hypothetical protein
VNDTARRLQGSDYPEDDGTVTDEVAAALSAYAAGRVDQAAVLAVLAEARVLVPVVAVLGEVEHDEAGLARDKTSDMAAVLLTGADGRLALLAFTSTSAMAAWDPTARPVPVATRLAALTALQEGAAALVVDVAGPVTVVAQGDDLHGLASGWAVGRVGEQPVWIRPAGE